MFVFEKGCLSFQESKDTCFPDSVEKFYQFQQGSFKKLEICALTIGNFGVFFQNELVEILQHQTTD